MAHGDFWTNNLMFQEDPATGRPLAVKFLDFQMSCLAHPAIDILYFLYICTDLPFRKAHLTDCLREYFDVLQGYLRPTLEMEFEEFLAEFNDRRDVAVNGGLWVSTY